MGDGYTHRTRPYPGDAPELVTLWNPACLCGHAQARHEPDIDSREHAYYGRCSHADCACGAFDEDEA